VKLRPEVAAALAGHGLRPDVTDTPETLRDELNDVYLVEVRELRERQRAGEIAMRDYAAAVTRLRERFPLLALPLTEWTVKD
jgi:hypothetical protein